MTQKDIHMILLGNSQKASNRRKPPNFKFRCIQENPFSFNPTSISETTNSLFINTKLYITTMFQGSERKVQIFHVLIV